MYNRIQVKEKINNSEIDEKIVKQSTATIDGKMMNENERMQRKWNET